MKKYIYNLLLLFVGTLAFTACTDEEGSDPGNDGAPSAVIYNYATEAPNDPDNDATFGIATNNKTAKLYYFAEKKADAEARNMNDAAYADYVVANGKEATLEKDEFSGGNFANVLLTGLKGEYTISFVAVNGNQKTLRQTTFVGLEWVDVAEGTYNFSERAQGRLGVDASTTTTLQYLKTEPNKYRFKNLYGVGKSLILNKTSETAETASGKLTFYTVAAQETPFSFGSYGAIGVRDVATWQNDESYITSSMGCYIYDDSHNASITLQYFVSAGSLGYGADTFVANK